MNTLYELTRQMAEIEERLVETGGELTPEIEELWQETAESLPKKIDNYNALVKNYEAAVEAKKKEENRLKEERKIDERIICNIKNHLIDVMTRFGYRRIDGKLCKVFLSSSTSTEVDEDLLLQPYGGKIQKFQEQLPSWLTVEFKVNKTALKDAYKDKDVTPAGVQFVKGTTLRIK